MNPINGLIGQEHAKRIMTRAAWYIRNHPDEVADSYCFIGPPSSGKTICARALADAAGLPLLELQPQSVRNANDLRNRIEEFIADDNGNVAFDLATNVTLTPRIAVFIDEVHQITNGTEQGLLKALEPNDRLLVSESGAVCTQRIVFMFATTDRGDLFDALDTRTVKIPLRLYSQAEVAEIVKLNYPHWPMRACELVARYNPTIPREALAFARDCAIEVKMTGNTNLTQVARRIAEDHRIDEHGMTAARLAILTTLGQAPVSRSRIRHVAGVKDAELQKFILPPLLASLPDRKMPLVTVSNKGYCITPAGLSELDKREIPNRGHHAIPESVRSLFPADEPENTSGASEGVREAGVVEFRRKA